MFFPKWMGKRKGVKKVETDIMKEWTARKEKKVGGKRYEARSRGRSSPDTLAF